MPNWCYNNLSVEIDTDYIENLYNCIYNILKIKLKLPENETNTFSFSIISNLLETIDLNNFKNLDETNYIKSFVDECKSYGIARNNSDYDNSGDFSFESGWGPPTESLLEISDKFKMISINIDYEESGSDFGGEMTIYHGEIIEQNEWSLSQKNWKEYGGSHVINFIFDYLLKEEVIIKTNDLLINFKNKEEIIKFCKINNNALEIIEEYIYDYIYEYAYEFDLENCEDKIINEFRKYINNQILILKDK
jgi:hypothetical protein